METFNAYIPGTVFIMIKDTETRKGKKNDILKSNFSFLFDEEDFHVNSSNI